LLLILIRFQKFRAHFPFADNPGVTDCDEIRYREFLSIWKDADPDRPEVTTAKEFLAKKLIGEK